MLGLTMQLDVSVNTVHYAGSWDDRFTYKGTKRDQLLSNKNYKLIFDATLEQSWERSVLGNGPVKVSRLTSSSVFHEGLLAR